jgi:hypothetical protein
MMAKKRKYKYRCKTHGCLKVNGVSGICGAIIVGGTGDKCGAHGNTKCENKIKITDLTE